MRTLLAIGGGLVATAWAAGFVDAVLFAAEPEPELLFTRKREFKIPFQIDAPKSPDERPVEVHLYMSDSRGVEAWPLIARVPPDVESFPFTARQDGEYWFVVRTVDSQGRLLPETQGETKPELKVLVDATPPVLDLQGMASPRGEVIMLRWHCEDMFLASDRPTVEYRSALDVDAPWRPLAINPGFDGEANIPAPAEPITVRATATDMAGNTTTRELVVDKDCKTPVRGVATDSPPAASPVAGAETGIAASAVPGAAPAAVPSSANSASPGVPATVPNSANYAAAFGAPPTSAASDPFGYSPTAPTATPAAATGPTAYGTAYETPTASVPTAASRDAALDLFEGLKPGSAAPNIADPTAKMPGPGTLASASPAQNPAPVSPAALAGPTSVVTTPAMLAPSVPNDVTPDMVPAMAFQLDYDVESVGPSGISKVEIWGTTDGGRSWKLFGTDDDRRSPIKVEVPTEGAYGFKLLVQTGSGLGGEAPKPGDAPDKWVLVDVTKPRAEFQAITNAEGSPSDLVIRWTAADEHIETRPIALSFSYEPQGPWYPIAQDLENTGVYYWRGDARRPKQVHLKLEVKDMAGNVATVLSSDATGADRMQPRVQVRSARAVPDPATTLR